jgi:hypothetical protein
MVAVGVAALLCSLKFREGLIDIIHWRHIVGNLIAI